MRRLLIHNAGELLHPEEAGRGVQRHQGGAIYAEDGRIAWIGPEDALPAAAADAPRYDAGGGAVPIFT